jgi:hypothetical protein
MTEQLNDVVSMMIQSSFYPDITVVREMNDEVKKYTNKANDDDDDCCTITTVTSEEADEVDETDQIQQQAEQKPIRKLVRFGSVRIHHHSLIAASTLPVLEVRATQNRVADDEDDDDIYTLDEHQKRVAATFQQKNMIGPFLSLEWKPIQTIRIPTVQQYDTIRTGHRRPFSMLRISKVNKEQIVQNSIEAAMVTTNNSHNNKTKQTQQQAIDKIRREEIFEEKLVLREAAATIVKKCKSNVQQESAINFLQNQGFVKTATAVQSQNKRHQHDIDVSTVDKLSKRHGTVASPCCSNENQQNVQLVQSSSNSGSIETISTTSASPASPPSRILTLNDLHAWDRREFGVSSNVSFALATAKKSKVKSVTTTTKTIPLICIINEDIVQQQQEQQYYRQIQQLSSTNNISIDSNNTTTELISTNNKVDIHDGKKKSKSLLKKITKKSKKLIAKHIFLTTDTAQVAPAPVAKIVHV